MPFSLDKCSILSQKSEALTSHISFHDNCQALIPNSLEGFNIFLKLDHRFQILIKHSSSYLAAYFSAEGIGRSSRSSTQGISIKDLLTNLHIFFTYSRCHNILGFHRINCNACFLDEQVTASPLMVKKKKKKSIYLWIYSMISFQPNHHLNNILIQVKAHLNIIHSAWYPKDISKISIFLSNGIYQDQIL